MLDKTGKETAFDPSSNQITSSEIKSVVLDVFLLEGVFVANTLTAVPVLQSSPTLEINISPVFCSCVTSSVKS